MIRAVLFDLGGTLYDYRTLERSQLEALVTVARAHGIEQEPGVLAQVHRESLRQVFHEYLPRPFYLHRDLFRDALASMLAHFGHELRDELFCRHQEELDRSQSRDLELRAGVVETLVALRSQGLRLGIVSNIDSDQLERFTRAAELAERFDWILSSEEAGSCKPDPEIFRIALERSGCPAPQVLFVGDTARQDVEGANRAAMRSVLLWHRSDRDPPAHSPHPRYVIRRIPELLELVPRPCHARNSSSPQFDSEVIS